MKAKQWSLVVPFCMLPAFAQAEVEIYGRINAGFDSVKEIALRGQGQRINGVNDNTSRIGFRGKENLGNGLAAIWQVESRIEIDGSKERAWASRQSFIGLETAGYGVFKLGYLDNFGKESWMDDIDPIKVKAFENNFVRVTGERVKNAVSYYSPNWYGWELALTYGTSELDHKQMEDAGLKHPDNAQHTYDVGISYQYGPYLAAYEYTKFEGQNRHKKAALPVNAHNHRVQFGYDGDAAFWTVAYQQGEGVSTALYEDGDFKDALKMLGWDYKKGGPAKYREMSVASEYKLGKKMRLKAYVTKGWDLKTDQGTISDSGYLQYAAAVRYDLSKRTNLELAAGQWSFDTDHLDKANGVGFGIFHKF